MQAAKLAALLAAALVTAGTSTRNDAAEALLSAAIAAPAHVSYTGTVEELSLGSDASQASVFDVRHRAPDRTSERYSSPSSLSGDAVLALGDTSYAIDVKRRRVVESENDALDDKTAFAADYALLRKNYRAVSRPGETFAGRSVGVIALVNDYTGRPTLILRVDRVTKLVLDKQTFGSDGSLVSEMRFEQVAYDPSFTPADFAVPKQYTLVHGPKRARASEAIGALVARAGFAARGPTRLPNGFAALEGTLVDIEGVRTLHLFYSDGIETLSLFENGGTSVLDMSRYHPQATRVANRDARYAENGATTVLAWTDGTRQYALVGDFSLDDLQRIAASI